MKHTYKVGDKIRMKEDCFPSKKGDILTIGEHLGVLEVLNNKGEFTCSCQDKWEPISDGWQVGDVLVNKYKYKREIWGILGKGYYLSDENNSQDGRLYTKETLESYGYKPLIAPPTEETIEIMGKKYKKEDVVGRLAELVEVKE